MKQRLKTLLSILSIIAIITNTFTLSTLAQQKRPRRASATNDERIAPGARVLPRGYVLVLRMETRLDSGKNHASDRFQTRIDEAMTDEAGNMVLPANLLVIGHVSEVSPAQMRRRSGLIEITFDKMIMPNGRELPIKGILTSADASERKKLKVDEEGIIGGGSPVKRNTVFIGGGVAAGAVIGAIAGGAALGAGVGVAVGVVAVLLAKGKEAVVEPGTLIGVELIEPLDLNQQGSITPHPTTPTTPTYPGAPNNNPANNNPLNNPPANNNGGGNQQPVPYQPPPPLEPQLLKLSFLQAERISGGSIMVVATAETTTSGWRVKTEQQINRETLEVWVKGTPPEGRAARIASHPTVTTTVPDPTGVIRRVIVHGLGGDRVVNLPAKSTR